MKVRWLVVAAALAMLCGSLHAGQKSKPGSGSRRKNARPAPAAASTGTVESVGTAIKDLTATFGSRYPKGAEYLERLGRVRKLLQSSPEQGAKALSALQREALLANPLLDFDRLLLIKRKPVGDPRRAKGTGRGLGEYLGLPRQSSWQLDRIPRVDNWENEIAVLRPVGPEGKLTTFYRPPGQRLINDMDLHFDAGKLLFSMPAEGNMWQVFEMGTGLPASPAPAGQAGGGGARQVTPTGRGDVHNYDACYLPDERIIFISTAPLQGVPCNATVNVGMLYVMDGDGGNIRQLCFDQDHNYCPTVTNDGQILYLRWEYTDIPHVWGRYLFTMNPDGTGQRELYGSGEYWPNGIFYARPIPGHPTKVVGIVTGHHVGRVGELVIFDTGRGLNSTGGVARRIASRGRRLEPLIQDKLTEHSWPKFLHPWPLCDPSTPLGAGKYFLVSAKPAPRDLWGIYLVDVFDNVTLVKEVEGCALLEPIPLQKSKRPPVIAGRVDLKRKDALIYLQDVYEGPGLKGVPRGTVKELRLFTYHFVYQRMAGINQNVGTDGPWEPKRVLGTVPVEADGSAMFRVPANTPISIQPLDADGNALQLMRSWTTAMPGENLSCVGCHERRTDAVPNRATIAVGKTPSEIRPWYGPVRGFSFRREVQPVLDKYCVACHGSTEVAEVNGSGRSDKKALPDLRGDQGKLVAFSNRDPKPKVIHGVARDELYKKYGGVFAPAFVELRRYVRVGGFESDIRMLDPGEFHADTSPLVQMLTKGHHGVRLDREAWERLTTWIDLNAPCHGTWYETAGATKPRKYHARRRTLRKLYVGIDDDPEAYPQTPRDPGRSVKPAVAPKRPVKPVSCPGWPFDADEARRRQAAKGPTERAIDLGGGVKLDLVRIPAGQFLMGDPHGHHDERPVTRVKIARGFWMGKFEITNEQYRLLDKDHDSRFEHKGSWIFSEKHLGWRVNHPKQPVVRVSWVEANDFCRRLSAGTGLNVSLPTEAQWEYACRAGTGTSLSYGDPDTDFSPFANMADVTIRGLAYDTDGRYTADLVPRDARFNDGKLVTADVGTYKPNPWGLHDVHGNAWEWTRSAYKPYPYEADDGRNGPNGPGRRVVRGGSWRDRPKRCRSAFRLSYPAWRRVYDVGFRVVVESPEGQGK